MRKIIEKILVSLAMIALASAVSFAQTAVRGSVKDDKGEVIPGAAVMLNGNTSVAVVSDMEGNYSLTLPSGIKDPVLTVRVLGYRELEITVAGRAVIDIVLQEESEELEDAVVIGYGSDRKSVV